LLSIQFFSYPKVPTFKKKLKHLFEPSSSCPLGTTRPTNSSQGATPMTDVAILYFSGYGHTVKQAEALEEGARSVAGTNVHVLRLDESGELPEGGWDTLKSAHAIVFGSPTYMGGPAWQFKKVADASSKPWFGQEWKDKIAGAFTTSATTNGDKGQPSPTS
jgi:multimeric flavodoxin WrbA